jgi:type IV pilus assembly protein PilB
MPPQRPLGQILIEMGAIDERRLNEALDQQKRKPGTKIGQAMIELGFIDELTLTKALCRQFRLPFVDLTRARILPQVAELVPKNVVNDFNVVPVKVTEGKLILATDDPMVTFAVDDLRFVLNREITFALTPPSALANARAEAYGLGERVDPAVRKQAAKGGKPAAEEDADAPVIRLVHEIMEQALSTRASDIHIEPFADRLRVRYRIDGVCTEAHSLDTELIGPVTTRVKVLAKMDIAEHRKPQDGRINLRLLGRPIDMRVSLVPGYHGEALVLRLLDREAGLVDLETLGFGGDDLDRFERVIRRPNGIFLVTGPTGSGKTTTLYAALKRLNKPNVKIITAENPVEYHLAGVNQSEVRHQIGLDFARILRAMLRQAPNIILVGEIRDQETADIAIQAALTGHLVFSTLHTNDAPSALTRLIDMGVKPFLVSTAVMAVMAQRLVRRLCLNCRQPTTPAPSLLAAVGLTPAEIGGKTIYRATGCRECRFEGYRGRVGIYELFQMDAHVREATFRRSSTMDIRDQARLTGGLRSLREDGIRKILEGTTSIEELLRTTGQAEVLGRSESEAAVASGAGSGS